MTEVSLPHIPFPSRHLSSADVGSISSHPFAAGRFSDIHGATLGGRRVALKYFRRHLMSDVSQIAKRFFNEVRVCVLLHSTGVKVVLFVGIFPTGKHPFCIAYGYMDNLDLRQYLRNEPNAGRLKLLTDIAQDLNRMHDFGMVHGRLEATNVLIDKDGTPHISGLGNVRILPHSTAWTMEGEVGTDWLRSRTEVTSILPPTKSSDMYNFGILAFEILTGHAPFSELTSTEAMYLMQGGCRPPQQEYLGISGRLWSMLEKCWCITPSQRMSIGKALDLLKEELQETSSS